MTNGLALMPKRTRESTSKVRTGCITCKARRVKCDEATPQCQRCAVGGRRCEYKTTRTATNRKSITIYLPPTQSPPLLFINDRSLDYFQRNLATTLDGELNSDSEFWGKLVLQLSHFEPSVRHAVSAISLFYRDVVSSLRDPAGYVNANPEARQEWNRAISSLSARIEEQPNSSLVPLVCCLLFTCIEFLKGNAESSMLHIQNGFKILANMRVLGSDTHSDRRFSHSSNDFANIEDHIVPIFSRLNVLCSLAGRITPQICCANARKDSPPANLAESRRQLFEISDTCIRFIRKVSPKAASQQVGFEDIIEQTKLQIRLDEWHNQLHELLGRAQSAIFLQNRHAINLLLVQYKVVYIWIRVCTTAEESATDSYHADFEELVHYSEQIAKPNGRTSIPQPMSFNIHILGPLFYTALKCRHSKLRRRALDLLRLAPRREGLWNAHHAYMTAKRVIELEERCLNSQGLPDESSRLHGLHLPDDDARVYRIDETPTDSAKIDQNLVPSPACPGTLEVVFQTKPWGLSRGYQEVTEYLTI